MKGNFDGSIASLTELEEQCNAFEDANSAKLEKLEAVIDVGGSKRTEGTFKFFSGPAKELGKAVISESGSFSCFIKDNKKNVSISRSS